MKLFQSTLPRRERPSWEILSVRRRYFNPRSREGSDPREELIASRCIISIHAPAKGATDLCGRRHGGVLISIHAPAKGATTFSTWVDEALEFQSTLPRRERPHAFPILLLLFPLFQSTFPRRERPVLQTHHRLRNYFNPRSREGSDHNVDDCGTGTGDFNPRSREGSDPENIRSTALSGNFNPRSREGSDWL